MRASRSEKLAVVAVSPRLEAFLEMLAVGHGQARLTLVAYSHFDVPRVAVEKVLPHARFPK